MFRNDLVIIIIIIIIIIVVVVVVVVVVVWRSWIIGDNERDVLVAFVFWDAWF